MKKILKKIFLVVLIQGYAKAANLLSRFVMVKLLTVADYGYFALLLSWVQVGSRVMAGSIDKLLIREIGGSTKIDSPDIKGLTIWSFSIFALLSLAITLVAGLMLFNWGLTSHTLEVITPYFIVLSIIYAFYILHESILQGLNKSIASRLVQYLVLPSLTLLALLIIIFNLNGNTIDFRSFMVVILSINGISALVGFLLIYKHFLKKLRKTAINLENKSTWKSYSASILLVTVTQVIFQKLDFLMLGYLEPPEAVAIYSIPSTITQAFSLILIGFNVVMEPKISSYYAKNRLIKLVPFIQQNTRIQTLLMLGTSAVCILFGTYFLELFGENYVQGSQILIILSFVPIVIAVSGPLLVILKMTGHVREINMAFMRALIFHFFVSYFLIQTLHSTGAAWALLSSVIMLRIQLLIIMKKKLGFSTLIFT